MWSALIFQGSLDDAMFLSACFPPFTPLWTASADAESIDASIGGIIKRVAVLLVLLSGLGVVLFYVGLKYAFPDSPY